MSENDNELKDFETKLKLLKAKNKPFDLTNATDIIIESAFLGALLDKNFYYKAQSHKICIYFENVHVHIKLDKENLKRFKNSIYHL